MSAAGPTAQREYPAARNAALAANATPSWAPRKAGRAAFTTAIAAASVTIVPLRAVVGRGQGKSRGEMAVASVLEAARRVHPILEAARQGGARVGISGDATYDWGCWGLLAVLTAFARID